MNSNNNHPESDCGNYPIPAPPTELPKEAEGKATLKAKELVEGFKRYSQGGTNGSIELHNAKQCALRCVDEIIKSWKDWDDWEIEKWQQVRTAINQI